jgi:hypothetical protein
VENRSDSRRLASAIKQFTGLYRVTVVQVNHALAEEFRSLPHALDIWHKQSQMPLEEFHRWRLASSVGWL